MTKETIRNVPVIVAAITVEATVTNTDERKQTILKQEMRSFALQYSVHLFDVVIVVVDVHRFMPLLSLFEIISLGIV